MKAIDYPVFFFENSKFWLGKLLFDVGVFLGREYCVHPIRFSLGAEERQLKRIKEREAATIIQIWHHQ